MCGAVATFSCLDATGKYLIGYMHPLEVVWARYFGAFLLALVFLNPVTKPGMMVTNRPLLQVGRSALLLFSTALNFFALRSLQLDEVLSILFSTPFIVAALCGPLLGEWVGWRRWIAIGVGFFGVLLVARPGFGGLHPAALLSFGSAICYALYVISTRLLARTDSSETTLFYSNLVGALAMLPVVPFVWTTPSSVFIVALMVLIGAFGSFGHYLLISRPPAGAGVGLGAVHLYAVGMDDDIGISGVRRHPAPLDHRGRADRRVVGALFAQPRAQGGHGDAHHAGCLSVGTKAKFCRVIRPFEDHAWRR